MDFLDSLVRFETALWNTVEHRLVREAEVGLGTLLALRVLQRHEGAGRVNELSRELGLTIGAASKLVDRLERDGLARRSPHPSDRRSSVVSLTDSGERARGKAQATAERVLSEVIGDDAHVAAARSVLTLLETRLNAVPSPG